MGKNLKGKECGNGICQRKDGRYCARFVDRNGKRRYHYFTSLPEARNWLADAPVSYTHLSVARTEYKQNVVFDVPAGAAATLPSVLFTVWRNLDGFYRF